MGFFYEKPLRLGLGRPGAPEKTAGKGKEPRDLVPMVEVPAGEFIYQDGKAIIETPFLIDVYPVATQQYEKFIKDGGYQKDAYHGTGVGPR